MRNLIFLLLFLINGASCLQAQHGCVGYANVSADGLYGTTGGGQGRIVHVQSRQQLETLCGVAEPLTIIIDKDIKGDAKARHDYIRVASNKTIVGAGRGVTFSYLGLDFKQQHNIIVRNLRITKANPDAMAFRSCSHVWVDHCDLSDCDDGLLDYTLGSSYLTVSYTKLSHHDKVSICCSGTGHAEDFQRQRNTYHHCWFADNVQRNPRIGYGRLHVFNTYYTDISLYCIGYFCRAKAISEHNYFLRSKNPYRQMYSEDPSSAYYAEIAALGDIYDRCEGNTTPTTTSLRDDERPPYLYDFALDDANRVPELAQSLCGPQQDVEYDIITLPGNGKKDVRDLDSLRWNPVEGAVEYTVSFGATPETMTSQTTDKTALAVEKKLTPGAIYYWKVVAHTRKGDHESALLRFQTEPTQSASAAASRRKTAVAAMHEGVNEAEHLMRCERMFIERQDGTYFHASNDTVTTGEAGKGTLTGVWADRNMTADISLTYFDENDGHAEYAILVGEREIARWKADRDTEKLETFTATDVPLFTGDTIRIEVITDNKMLGRTDCITIVPSKAKALLRSDSPETFSWRVVSNAGNVVQKAYRVLVASSKEKLSKGVGDLWDSGKRMSDKQLWVDYEGIPLKSNQHAYAAVKVWIDSSDGPAEMEWSNAVEITRGLPTESDWSGRWIGIENTLEGERERTTYTRLAARYLRKDFIIKQKQISRATAYVAGLGLYKMYVNGTLLGGNEALTPMPSDYRKTIYYRHYDITPILRSDSNAVGVVLGNGRFFPMRQNKAWKAPVFGFPKCRVNIIVEYSDGTSERIVTDETWKITASGPIRANNEYDGEEYDARLELGNWTLPSYDDSAWEKAERSAVPDGVLTLQTAPAMRETPLRDSRAGSPKVSLVSAMGKPSAYVIDFGQNMAGWVAFKPSGNAGDTIRLRYAERLNADGTLYTANLRDAHSEDIYVCNGEEKGRKEWHSTFAYHGFRYVEVTGMEEVRAEMFEARVVSDEMHRSGTFACSDQTLNTVVKNARWGILSNYKGMPVDCPQRNERQPWLGDRTVGALGESFLFDNAELYAKWMRDICEAQRSDGCIPDVAPAFWNYYTDDVTWPAALPFCCDMLMRQYGDVKTMKSAYPYMKKWMNHIVERYTKDGIVTKDKYGDWCMPPESAELVHSEDPARQTDGALIATAYTVKCLELLERFAALQQLSDDAKTWKSLRESYAAAFDKRFRNADNTYSNNTPTASVLALAFGLVPENLKEEVAQNLVRRIMNDYDAHIPCGVIGTSWLLRTLTEMGRGDLACFIATQKSFPSWGYMVEHGATTIWELWNGDTANPSMNSGNHVMLLGDLLTWCFEYLGGIRQDGDAYRHMVLNPDFTLGQITHAEAGYDTPYGRLESRWKREGSMVKWMVSVPPCATADVVLPDGKVEKVGSGTYFYEVKAPMRDAHVVEHEFVYADDMYEEEAFPSCHAATITETKEGDLVAAYFGGLYERHPEVCIYTQRKAKGTAEWSAPVKAADGVYGDDGFIGTDVSPYEDRKACWNPVLFTMPDGELWLFFKIGANVKDWTGWVVKSRDGGRSWSRREALPEGFLGPIKNKPEIINGKLLCPSSTENNGWRLHFELYDMAAKEWKYVGPIEGEKALNTEDQPVDAQLVSGSAGEYYVYADTCNTAKLKEINAIQPSILRLKDGRLKVIARTRHGRLAESYSNDGGLTWSRVALTDIPNCQSGTDAVTLRNGKHVLIYNNNPVKPGDKKSNRTPLSLALSDDGTSWHHWITLEDCPVPQYSYPSIIQTEDGMLHVVYTWRRERIAYAKIKQ